MSRRVGGNDRDNFLNVSSQSVVGFEFLLFSKETRCRVLSVETVDHHPWNEGEAWRGEGEGREREIGQEPDESVLQRFESVGGRFAWLWNRPGDNETRYETRSEDQIRTSVLKKKIG